MGVISKPIHKVPLNGSRVGEEIRIPGKDFPTTIFEAETPVLAEDTAAAAEISADAAIAPEILFAGLILIGLLYSARYFIVPLLKLIKVPGANWFSDLINKVLSVITDPIKNFLKGILVYIANGIEAHAEPITRAMESAAWAMHDMSIELANLAASTTEAIALIVTKVIPREINRELKPVRRRVNAVYADILAYNAIAKQNGFTSFRQLLKVETPRITELRKAETYVKTQGHTSLAGALSVYETTTKRVKVYEETVRKLKFYDVPSWIRHITTITTRTIPETIKKLALRVGKVETQIKQNKFGIPVLMALMTPAAIARWFRPAIPQVCTEVGECAASNILGKSNWQWLKDMLGLLLAASIDALVLADLCAIARLAQTVASDFKPALEALAVGEGTLAGIGCGGAGYQPPAPNYQTGFSAI